MTTLETRIQGKIDEYKKITSRIPELRRKLASAAAAAAGGADDPQIRDELERALEVQEEETAYLLDVMPYLEQLDEGLEDKRLSFMVDEEAVREKRTGAIDSLIKEKSVAKRSQLFLDYLKTIENHIVFGEATTTMGKHARRGIRNLDAEYTCDACGSARTFERSTSSLVCVECGISVDHIEVSTRNLSYTDEHEGRSGPTFSYVRVNRVKEWLSSIQAKENSVIPDEVIDAVKAELRKERVSTRGEIKPSRVKPILKKLGLSKYSEHLHLIVSLLNGTPAVQISREIEAKIMAMFHQIQAPFARHCPKGRKNFLSYPYVLRKFSELLGQDQLLSYFPLLKSVAKLRQSDDIWKKICHDLDWEFIASC